MRLTCLVSALCLAHGLLANPIGKHPANPHYFVYRGRPLVLITTDQHYGAVINRDFDYVPFLDRLREYGMNLTRIYPGGYVKSRISTHPAILWALRPTAIFCPGGNRGKPEPART